MTIIGFFLAAVSLVMAVLVSPIFLSIGDWSILFIIPFVIGLLMVMKDA